MISVDGPLTRVNTQVWQDFSARAELTCALIEQALNASALGRAEVQVRAAPQWAGGQLLDTAGQCEFVNAALTRAESVLTRARVSAQRLRDGAAHAAAIFSQAEQHATGLFSAFGWLFWPWRGNAGMGLAWGTYQTMTGPEVRADTLSEYAQRLIAGAANSGQIAAAAAFGGEIGDAFLSPFTHRQVHVFDQQTGQEYVLREQTGAAFFAGIRHPTAVLSGFIKRLSEDIRTDTAAQERRDLEAMRASSSKLAAAAAAPRIQAGARERPTPVRVEQLITGLSKLDSTRAHGHVQVLKHETKAASGETQVSWTVNIRGTQTWDLGGSNPQNLAANLRQVAGLPNTQEQVVLQAMQAAGIKPGQPVELVGHSQGGIAAARIASDPIVRKRYQIVDVVTFGSPNSHISAGENTLRVEGSFDPVPVLDGQPHNREGITVTSPTRVDSAGGTKSPHAQETYAAIAREIDRSDNPDLRAWKDRRAAQLHLSEKTRTTAYDFLSVQTRTPLR